MPTSNSNNTPKIPATAHDAAAEEFAGYTLDDLRYRRAVLALHKEFAKEKFLTKVSKIQSASPFSKSYIPSKGGNLGKVGAIAGKVMNGLNYLDYAVLGYSAFSAVKKVFGVFGKFKKKH